VVWSAYESHKTIQQLFNYFSLISSWIKNSILENIKEIRRKYKKRLSFSMITLRRSTNMEKRQANRRIIAVMKRKMAEVWAL